MANFRERIVMSELLNLVEKEVITKETASAIIEHYDGQTGRSFSKHTITVAIITVMALMGVGVGVLAADKWDDLGKGMKTLLAVLPVFFGLAATVWAMIWKHSVVELRETAGTILVLAVGLSVGLINDIYAIDIATHLFFLVWLLLSLPVLYIMRSQVVYFIALALVMAALFAAAADSIDLLFGWGAALFVLPMMYLTYRKSRNHDQILNMAFATIAFVPIFLLAMFNQTSAFGVENLVQSALMLVSIYLGLLFIAADNNYFRRIHLISGNLTSTVFLLSAAMGLLFLLVDPWSEKIGASTSTSLLFNILCWLSMFILAALFIFNFAKRVMARNFHGLSVASLPFFVLAAVLISGTNADVHPYAVYIFSAYLLLVIFDYILYGLNRKDMAALNSGTVLFFTYALVRTLDSDFTTPVKGLILIGIALCLAVVMYVLKSVVSPHFIRDNQPDCPLDNDDNRDAEVVDDGSDLPA